MAGHMLTKYFSKKKYDIVTMARSNSDVEKNIENTEDIKKYFNLIKNDFDYIINCIGLLVKDSNDRPDRSIMINSWFPHMIENSIKNSKTRLIHLSTDCIFDGRLGNYTEESLPTEDNWYGRSKFYGEIKNDKDITFRMSIIGTELKTKGSGLLNWILSNPDPDIPGWKNVLWNGMTTLQLAKCIEQYMLEPKISGLYHLVSNVNHISKYDLLCKINNIFELEKNIIKSRAHKSTNKILINSRKDFHFSIPNYDIQLKELKNFI